MRLAVSRFVVAALAGCWQLHEDAANLAAEGLCTITSGQISHLLMEAWTKGRAWAFTDFELKDTVASGERPCSVTYQKRSCPGWKGDLQPSASGENESEPREDLVKSQYCLPASVKQICEDPNGTEDSSEE